MAAQLPHLSIWEDAIADGIVRFENAGTRDGARLVLTAQGRRGSVLPPPERGGRIANGPSNRNAARGFLARRLNVRDAMDKHRADPRLLWLVSVLAAATFVIYLAQQA